MAIAKSTTFAAKCAGLLSRRLVNHRDDTRLVSARFDRGYSKDRVKAFVEKVLLMAWMLPFRLTETDIA